MKNMKLDRIENIDILRAIGIITMIMGHVGFGKAFDYFIHAWHMPMFFLISGFFYKEKQETIWQFLKYRARALLVPYFIFGLLNELLYIVNYECIEPTVSGKLDPLKELLLDNTNIPLAGALWFLTAMFIANVIYYVLSRKIRNIVMLTIIVFAISIFGNIATMVLPFRLPWAMDAAFVGVGLYHVGRGIKYLSLKKNILYLRIQMWIFLTFLAIFFIFLNGYINMRTGHYAIVPLFWINAVLDTIVLWNFSSYINDLLVKKKCLVKISKPIKNIGKDSIVFLCCNQFVIFYVAKVLSVFNMHIVITRVLTLIISILVLYILDYGVQSTPIKAMFGR